jgi:hypothetical protein
MKLEWESNATFRLSLVGALKALTYLISWKLIEKKETITEKKAIATYK